MSDNRKFLTKSSKERTLCVALNSDLHGKKYTGDNADNVDVDVDNVEVDNINVDNDVDNDDINENQNKSKNNNNCIGFKSGEDKIPCPFFGKNGKRTCINHRDMENYTDDMLKNVSKCLLCYGKPRWRYIDNDNNGCDVCINRLKKDKCGKYGGLMANGQKCVKIVKEGTNYCSDHRDLISYTPEMLANQKWCSTGNHVRYCGDFSTCEKCRNVAKAKRKITKKIKERCTK